MKKPTRKPGTFKTGSFREFKEFTLAVVRGERKVDPAEPKIWVESADPSEKRATLVQFQSLRSRREASVAKEPRSVAPDRGPATEIGKRARHPDPPR